MFTFNLNKKILDKTVDESMAKAINNYKSFKYP